MYRQNGDKGAVLVEARRVYRGIKREYDILVREHNALAGSRRTGGEENSAALFHVYFKLCKRGVTANGSIGRSESG